MSDTNNQAAGSKAPATSPITSATARAAKDSARESAQPGHMPTARASIVAARMVPLDGRISLRVATEKKE